MCSDRWVVINNIVLLKTLGHMVVMSYWEMYCIKKNKKKQKQYLYGSLIVL